MRSPHMMYFAHPDLSAVAAEAWSACGQLNQIHTTLQTAYDGDLGPLPVVNDDDPALFCIRRARLRRQKGATTYWHETCPAKMGRDEMSVLDSRLKVYGVENLRIADGSIMPRITTGNTMAPYVIIGERASEMIRKAHGI
jgi:choline dehydrogenase-like flavoprotein